MIFAFEMRIGKAKENLLQASFGKVVGKKLHGIGSHEGSVLVRAGSFFAQGNKSKSHIFSDLGTNFHAQNCLVRKNGSESNCQTTKAAANIQDSLAGLQPQFRGDMALFRQLRVAKSRKIPDIPAISGLDLAKNCSVASLKLSPTWVGDDLVRFISPSTTAADKLGRWR